MDLGRCDVKKEPNFGLGMIRCDVGAEFWIIAHVGAEFCDEGAKFWTWRDAMEELNLDLVS